MRWLAYFATAALVGLQCAPAMADKRVALVIGNARYQHAPNLPNPANDAAAIDVLLKSAGFATVIARQNLGVSDLRREIRDFTEQTRDADIAVIYYAGHGIELNGMNYLVPVDASLRRDIDVEDETVPLDRLLQVLEPAKRLRLVILDACRENPFTKSMGRTMVSRSIGRGLARIEPVTSDTLVAFAAKAGSTAADGSGTHSPFTTALLKHMVTPGLDVRLAFGRVRDEVLANTNNRQEPFVYGSLGGKPVTLAALTTDDRTDSPPAGDPDAPAARDYEAAARLGTRDAWDAFLKKYPTGFYADLARAQRDKPSAPAASSDAKAKPPTKLEAALPDARPDRPDDDRKKKPPPTKGAEEKKKTKGASAGGGQMACCIRYKLRVGVASPEAACRNHIWMQQNNPAQAGVSNWCAL